MTNSFLLAFLSSVCRWSCQKILWFLNLSFKISNSVHDRVDVIIGLNLLIFQNSRFLNDFSRSNYLILKVHDRDHISVSLNFSIWGVFPLIWSCSWFLDDFSRSKSVRMHCKGLNVSKQLIQGGEQLHQKKSSIAGFPRCKLECIQIHVALLSRSLFFLSSNLWPIISVIQEHSTWEFQPLNSLPIFQYRHLSPKKRLKSNYAKLIFCPFLFLGEFDKAFPFLTKRKNQDT